MSEVDIRDTPALSAAFDEARPEAICHHAAQVSVARSVREPSVDAEINIVGMLNVISQAHRVGASRFVFASSGGALYGETSEAADETTVAMPISCAVRKIRRAISPRLATNKRVIGLIFTSAMCRTPWFL